MTLQEIKDWVKNAKCVDTLIDRIDNQWSTNIYLKEGKLYAISFCNGHPLEKRSKNHHVLRGEYLEPVEVKEKYRVIEETYYESASGAKFYS